MSINPTYVYDGNGLRVKKCLPNCSSPTSSTVYTFSGSKVIAEYDNGAAPSSPSREYIYSGGALLAKIEGSTTNYFHPEHLSNRLITDASGNVVGQRGHFPFGETWYETGTTTKLKFTTYERDGESGNDFAMARYDMSRLGRFASPDPLSGSTADPQSLNRYSHALNDPINLADPSGMFIAPQEMGLRGIGGYLNFDPFGWNWNGADLMRIPVYGWGYFSKTVPGQNGDGTITSSSWGYGIIGYFQGVPAPDIQSPIPPDPIAVFGGPKQPRSPFLIFMDSMSQKCKDALQNIGLLDAVARVAQTANIFDITAIAMQAASTYLGNAVGNQTVGEFFRATPERSAKTIIDVPKPGIYVRGGAGAFGGGDMYWLLHEMTHLAQPAADGRNLDVSLARRLGVQPRNDQNASQALSDYFNNECENGGPQ